MAVGTITMINVDNGSAIVNFGGYEERWSKGQMFGIVNFTADRSETISMHDEIQIKEDATVVFGGYVNEIKDAGKGQKIVTVLGYGSEVLNAKVDTTQAAKSPEFIVDAIKPAGYTVTSEATGVTISTYKKLATIRDVYREMNQRVDYTIRIDADKDINYESDGNTSSGITYNTSTDPVFVVDWGEKKEGYLRNNVTVLGFDANNTKITGTATNAASITNYGEYFMAYQFQYFADAAEANALALNLIKADPAEGGKIEVPIEYDIKLNQTVTLVDSVRSINGVFTIQDIRRSFPMGRMILSLGFADSDFYLASKQTESPSTATDINWQDDVFGVTTVTKYLSILGSAFNQKAYGDVNADEAIKRQGTLQVNSFNDETGANVQVLLPHGAIITACIVYGDNTGRDWKLRRRSINSGIEGTEKATAAIGTEDSTITDATIDNQNYVYWLNAEMVDTDTIYGARITFTVDECS